MKICVASFVTVLAALVGCVGFLEEAGLATPRAVASEYFESVGGGVSVVTASRTAFLTIAVKENESLPSGSFVEGSFEDPCGGPLILVSPKSGTQEGVLIFESGDISCLRPSRSYECTVTVYSDNTKSKAISTHRQLIRSELDSRWLEN